jgi:hypothetical protein
MNSIWGIDGNLLFGSMPISCSPSTAFVDWNDIYMIFQKEKNEKISILLIMHFISQPPQTPTLFSAHHSARFAHVAGGVSQAQCEKTG